MWFSWDMHCLIVEIVIVLFLTFLDYIRIFGNIFSYFFFVSRSGLLKFFIKLSKMRKKQHDFSSSELGLFTKYAACQSKFDSIE